MSTQFNCQKYFYFKLFSLVNKLFEFYGISTFADYLTPNLFLYK